MKLNDKKVEEVLANVIHKLSYAMGGSAEAYVKLKISESISALDTLITVIEFEQMENGL